LGWVRLPSLGSHLLHERVGQREALATAAIIAGVIGVTLSAPKHSDAYTGGGRLVAAIAVLAAFTAIPYLAGRHNPRAGGLLVLSAGTAFSASALTTKLVADELSAGDLPAALTWAVGTLVAASHRDGEGAAAEVPAASRTTEAAVGRAAQDRSG